MIPARRRKFEASRPGNLSRRIERAQDPLHGTVRDDDHSRDHQNNEQYRKRDLHLLPMRPTVGRI